MMKFFDWINEKLGLEDKSRFKYECTYMWSTLFALAFVGGIISSVFIILTYVNAVLFNPEILKPFVSEDMWMRILKDAKNPFFCESAIVANVFFGSFFLAFFIKSDFGKPICKLFTIIGSIPDLIFSKHCKQISKDK